METYYDDLLKSIHDMIQQENYQKSLELVSQELAMPYVPREVEEELLELYQQCVITMRSESTGPRYLNKSVVDLLKGNLDEQYMAIEVLKQSNIRNYLDEVQEYLSNDVNAMIRSLLLEAMFEQSITVPVTINYEGLQVDVIPAMIEPIKDSDGVLLAGKYLREWFENDNPTFYMLAMDCLIREAYLRLPFGIEKDESLSYALSIAEYIYQVNQDDGFDKFIDAINMRREVKFELLLTKHNI